MVKMAKFQTESNVFAGLMLRYKSKEPSKKLSELPKLKGKSLRKLQSYKVASKPKTAILGGGDVAFPLIFIGVVMEGLLVKGLTASSAFLQSSIIIVTTTVALLLLFIFAKKGKFYPAMPFLTAGCLVGWLITLLL